MIKLTQETVNSMLLQQDMEFRTDFAYTNTLLHSVIVTVPEPELLAVGAREVRSADPRRRILGVRLLRELKQYSEAAAVELGRMLASEQDTDVIYWIVGAFGFVKSDSVADQLRALVRYPNSGVRYNVATALANCGSSEIPADSVDALLALAGDENAECGFLLSLNLGRGGRSITTTY